jgi:hypothetical protein
LSFSDFQRYKKSGAEIWLLADARCPAGYQSGARLFAGSPIPALSTTLQRGEEINLAFAVFQRAA